jgi:hypothetical protein
MVALTSKGVKSRVLSHVTMKVTKKKTKARASNGGARARDKGRSHSKVPKKRSVVGRRGTPIKADSGKTKPAALQLKATRRVTSETKIPVAAEKPVTSLVPGCEPDGRGAAPPLPTPIVTFNI